MKHIRDPLYGYISVTETELDVISTPRVQRLRRVNQLGLSSAVYPGATHTRFEHSLGVMDLAGQLAESIGLSSGEVQAYRYAGLLHDVGHAPFSHAIEDVMEEELGVSHESRSCEIVDALASENVLPSSVNPELVKSAILGTSEYNIVAGAVDSDRMDYLRRDAFQTGLEHGNIDTQTIIRFAEAWDSRVVFSHKSIQALEGLLTARFHMRKSVYEHHTSKIVEKMLEKAVLNFIEQTQFDILTVLEWDDYQLHANLINSSGVARDIYESITNRNLFKRALILNEENIGREKLINFVEEANEPEIIEQEIASLAKIPAESVIVDIPSIPTGKNPDVGIIWNEAIRPLTELSSLPKSLKDSEWRNTTLGVYTKKKYRESVSEAAQNVIDI